MKLRLSLSTFIAVLALTWPLASFAAITTTNETQLAYDFQEDIEPAVISQIRGGVEYDVTMYMKFSNAFSADNARLWYATKNTSTGTITANPMPTFGSYGHYADPWLAQDSASGPYPQRLYATGVAFDRSTDGTGNVIDSGIGVWTSDNGGVSWSSPVSWTNATTLMDKPTIAVSHDATGGTNGYVYVTYALNGGIYLYVSQNGGATFTGPYTVVSQGFGLLAPEILVDNSGNLYVSTCQPAGNRMLLYYASRQTNPSLLSFRQIQSFATGDITRVSVNVDGSGTWVSAGTTPFTRLDSAHNRLSFVWHEADATTHMRVSFAAIDVTNVPGGGNGTRIGPTVIAAAGSGHNFNVGMDVDSAGGYLVTYYSFPGTTTTYSQAATYVTVGSTISAEPQTALTGTISDISVYTPFAFPNPPGQTPVRSVGDFHGVDYSNGTFKAVGISIVYPSGNPVLWTVTHH